MWFLNCSSTCWSVDPWPITVKQLDHATLGSDGIQFGEDDVNTNFDSWGRTRLLIYITLCSQSPFYEVGLLLLELEPSSNQDRNSYLLWPHCLRVVYSAQQVLSSSDSLERFVTHRAMFCQPPPPLHHNQPNMRRVVLRNYRTADLSPTIYCMF